MPTTDTLAAAIAKALAAGAASALVLLGSTGAVSAETPPFEPGPVLVLPEADPDPDPGPDPAPDLPEAQPEADPDPDPDPDPAPDLPLANPEAPDDPGDGDDGDDADEPEVEVGGTQVDRGALPRTGGTLAPFAAAGTGLAAAGAVLRRYARR